MLTIEQIATKIAAELPVETTEGGEAKNHYQTVYGFVTFLKQIGAASAHNPPKSGKKGKPAKLYAMSENAADLVTEWVSRISALIAADEVSALEARARLAQEELDRARSRAGQTETPAQ